MAERQIRRRRYEAAREMLLVLSRARPKLERIKGKFTLTINNGEEYASIILDGSGDFVPKENNNG